MYPSAELKRLAAKKDALEQRIVMNRARCQLNWQRIRGPLQVADRLHARWRKISPTLKALSVPMGFLFAQKRLARRSRSSWLQAVMRWAPIVLGAAQRVRLQRSRSAAAR